MSLEDAKFLRAQAEKCRWLALNTVDRNVARTLLHMADGYEARSEAIEISRPPG